MTIIGESPPETVTVVSASNRTRRTVAVRRGAVTTPEETEFDFSDDALLLSVVIAFGFLSLALPLVEATGDDLRIAATAPLTLLVLIVAAGVNNAIQSARVDSEPVDEESQ